MKFEEYRSFDATGLAELLAGGEVTARELLELAEGRARALAQQINAVSVWDLEHAEASLAAGLPEGPFRGVPFLLKDLYAFLQGTRLTNGSRLTRDVVADFDTTFIGRARAAGLVVFGKTTTPEFGLNVVTEPVLHGPCRNPWDPDHSPGGSSGGAAAAVAAGIVPMAHATDGGGSTRIPASHCGLVGLKPSRARVPMGPLIAEAWSGLATGLVISRSLRDTARFLDAVHGPENGDFYVCPPPSAPFRESLERSPGKLRVALVERAPLGIPLHPEVKTALDRAAHLLEEMGHHIEEATIPLEGERMATAFLDVVSANCANDLEAWAVRLGRRLDKEHLERCTLALVEQGRKVSAVAYLRSLQTVQQAARAFGDMFRRFDLILSPVCAAPPPKIGEIDQNDLLPLRFLERNRPYVCFTSLYNASGCPAISLPLHVSTQGLPIGIMLGARLGGEELLLSVAGEIERAMPWFDRVPPI